MRKLVQLKRVTDGDVGTEPLAAEGHRDLWAEAPLAHLLVVPQIQYSI